MWTKHLAREGWRGSVGDIGAWLVSAMWTRLTGDIHMYKISLLNFRVSWERPMGPPKSQIFFAKTRRSPSWALIEANQLRTQAKFADKENVHINLHFGNTKPIATITSPNLTCQRAVKCLKMLSTVSKSCVVTGNQSFFSHGMFKILFSFCTSTCNNPSLIIVRPKQSTLQISEWPLLPVLADYYQTVQVPVKAERPSWDKKVHHIIPSAHDLYDTVYMLQLTYKISHSLWHLKH